MTRSESPIVVKAVPAGIEQTGLDRLRYKAPSRVSTSGPTD